ncbi:MAG: hypothetical protein HYZ28_16545 [Myxococcales bacterium]|nr:hypothetical protein [Myxococcales bacterium]
MRAARRAATIVALACLLAARPAAAWLFFEHDRIGSEAVRRLPPEAKDRLQAAWTAATAARPNGDRYCKRIDLGVSAESVQDQARWCAGFSTLGAIAGDHACDPAEVSAVIESADWIGGVLVNSRDLAMEMALLDPGGPDRVDAWREHNLALQSLDPDLVARAQANWSHFLPPLEGESAKGRAPPLATDLTAYLSSALLAGDRLNAVAVYAHYHRLALAAATAAGCQHQEGAFNCDPAGAARLWQALAAEGFALHFLEDAFSSGHVAGTWGDVGQRLGSHDYYSERGLDVRTWSGDLYAAHGDAFLSELDEERTAAAVASSLSQLSRALEGSGSVVAAFPPPGGERPLSVCDPSVRIPSELGQLAGEEFIQEIIRQEPIPFSRRYGMPRLRGEVGPFIGVGLEANGFALLQGRELGHSDVRLRLSLGAGLALEGAFSQFMDGQMFADLFLVTSMHAYAVGRRGVGFGFRVRMPYVLVPGDLILVAAPAALINRQWAYRFAEVAAGGGLGEFQRLIILRKSLSLQFMLGREAIFSWVPEFGWHLELPMFQLSGDRSFTGAFAVESVLQFGAAMHLDTRAPAYGIYLGFSERFRRYVPQE